MEEVTLDDKEGTGTREAPAEGLSARLASERRKLESEKARFDAEMQSFARRAETAEAQLPAVLRDFDLRISELQRERDRQASELRADAERYRRDAETARRKRDGVPHAADELRGVVADDIRNARREFSDWANQNKVTGRSLAEARHAAVAQIGEGAVAEYEEARRRRACASDPLEAKAYGVIEESYGAKVPEYMHYLRERRPAVTGRLRMIILMPEEADGPLLLVAPLPSEGELPDDEFSWRIQSFLFDCGERSAREMDAVITLGEVLGSIAVEIRPWNAEPELVVIALTEGWDARPSLAATLTLAYDVGIGVDVPFLLTNSEVVPEPSSEPGPVSGGTLYSVSQRLGIPLADLIASIRANGLPMTDDRIDASVELSLRQILHIVDGRAEPSHEIGRPAPEQLLEPGSPQMIARRVLLKLMNGQRIGGRYNQADNVWGHHFADDEKDLAREVTMRLIREGILQLTRKSGRDFVSIDPHRLSDAQSLIDLRSTDASIFQGLS